MAIWIYTSLLLTAEMILLLYWIQLMRVNVENEYSDDWEEYETAGWDIQQKKK